MRWQTGHKRRSCPSPAPGQCPAGPHSYIEVKQNNKDSLMTAAHKPDWQRTTTLKTLNATPNGQVFQEFSTLGQKHFFANKMYFLISDLLRL